MTIKINHAKVVTASDAPGDAAAGKALAADWNADLVIDPSSIATDLDITAGTETTPKLMSPAQVKLAAETHGSVLSSEIAVTANRDSLLTDANNILTNSTASNYTITILSSTAFTAGQMLTKYRTGTGTLSFAAGVGVTFQGAEPTDTQYDHIGLRYRGANVWAWV